LSNNSGLAQGLLAMEPQRHGVITFLDRFFAG
jgi:hypothetical protein